MLKILGENYYLDLDAIDKYVIIPNPSGITDYNISVVKYEMVKIMTEILVTENEEVDEKLGEKSDLTIPFKLAFNTLLNKKLLNKY
jgi:hypothetical protein